uniref:Centrosomal protein of 128 kDa n=1 Tax=Callorhinchus milii TaxID=7868 RepID=A0A4W3J835_CALMI
MADLSSDSDSIRRKYSSRRRSPKVTSVVGAQGRHKTQSGDTSQNLRNVDQMLGDYRDLTSEQMKAVSKLRDNLEQSVDQLRNQRLHRSSHSTLQTSDLQSDSPTEGQCSSTSHPKDHAAHLNIRDRKYRSSVRFIDQPKPSNNIHIVHQSLRDLSSDQLRLGDNLEQEIEQRVKTDAETRKTLNHLSERLREVPRHEMASTRVERRLQEIEKGMRIERNLAEHHKEQLGHISVHLREVLKKRNAKDNEIEEIKKDKHLRLESEKCKIEKELERTRRRLDQSEGSREALLCQIDGLRSQLLKTEEDRADLQHRVLQQSSQRNSYAEKVDERPMLRAVDRSEREKRELEKQIVELTAELRRNAAMSEAEDIKRSVDRKDREQSELAAHVEVLTSDIEKREGQQLRMLERLKEIQNRYEDGMKDRKSIDQQVADLNRQLKESNMEAGKYQNQLKEVELLRLECEKKKDELKLRAQESIRQWKVKCKKLEHNLEKQKEAGSQAMERNSRVCKEKELLQGQHAAAMYQLEILRKELNDVILKRVQQEEDLHRKDVVLQELKAQQMDLSRELQDVRGFSSKLEADLHKQDALYTQSKEENQCLEDKIIALNRQHETDHEKLVERQRTIKELSSLRAELTNRLAEEEQQRKEMGKVIADAKARQDLAQEELSSLDKQLKLERDVHQRELADVKFEVQTLKTKHEKYVQEMIRIFHDEREEMENRIRTLMAELGDDKNLAKAQRRQVEKMKNECDKLAEQLTLSAEENSKFRRRCQMYKQDLEDKEKLVTSGEDRARGLEEKAFHLKEKICRLETERETILHSIGNEIEAVCKCVVKDADEKFTTISLMPGLENDPHRWLAEMKTKLQWLSEEVKERDGRESKLRRHLHLCRGQLKELVHNKECENQVYIEQITKQENLLQQMHQEKRDLMERMQRKDGKMRELQDRFVGLETSTRMALDHLESVPERLSILEDFQDLEDSQHQREIIEARYAKYREIVGSLQQQLEDSKRSIQEYRDQAMNASLRSGWLNNPICGDSKDFSSTLTDSEGCVSGNTCALHNRQTRARSQEVRIVGNGRLSPAEKEQH